MNDKKNPQKIISGYQPKPNPKSKPEKLPDLYFLNKNLKN